MRTKFEKVNLLLKLIFIFNVISIFLSSFILFATVNKLNGNLKSNTTEPAPLQMLPANVLKNRTVMPSENVLNELATGSFILDDFSKSINFNRLELEAGTYGAFGGICNASISETGYQDTTNLSLRLDYGLSLSQKAYSDYWSKIENIDMNKYRRISFNLKGAAGNEILYVVLNDGNESSKMKLFAVKSWRNIVVKFKDLDRPLNLDKFNGFIGFLFVREENTSLNGTVYLDNIMFDSGH